MPRIQTILHIALKFQFDCACFQGEASTNYAGKVEKKERRRQSTAPLITRQCLCLQCYTEM